MRPVRGLVALAIALVAACSFGGNPVVLDAGPADAAVDADPASCTAPFSVSAHGCHAFPAETAIRASAWAAARTACQAIGGDLPVIDSPAESSHVASAVANPNHRVWIGLTGTNLDGSTWTWLDTNQTVAERGLSLWVIGQPQAGERCALIRPLDGHWLGRDCAVKLVVVCEKF
jgi:hypothetical protein